MLLKKREKIDETWRKWRKLTRLQDWKDYVRARNDYVKVRREEKKIEKNIVDKCKRQPK